MENVSRRLCKLLSSTAILYSLSLSHAAAASLNEGFESPDNTVAQLQSEGWTFINNSNPEGTPATGWAIDNDSASLGGVLFPHSGLNWIGADFNSGANNVVSDWMILPTMTFQQASSLTLWTLSQPHPTLFQTASRCSSVSTRTVRMSVRPVPLPISATSLTRCST